MRKSYTILLALVVLLSTAMSVQALESKTIERYNGESASADWYETNGDITTYTYLSVTETKDGTDIYISTYTYGPCSWSEKSGYMFTNDNVFKIDKKLNSASLSEVEIEVCDYYTGETGTLTVQADWIGEGEISESSSKSSSKYDDYVWKSSDSSKYRDASATGSINGYDLGVSSYASLSSFKYAYMSMTK
ncbi:hypothetical protein [Methanosarcina sp.]|uniref:hypothetical protein n=1 Tax=Methanosarcina sp. TaxID=2213 RepID=UPI003C718BDF